MMHTECLTFVSSLIYSCNNSAPLGLLKIGINDFVLSALDRLSIVGNGGMGALTYEPETFVIS